MEGLGFTSIAPKLYPISKAARLLLLTAFLLSRLLIELSSNLRNLFLINDVVAFEDRACFVAGDLHSG